MLKKTHLLVLLNAIAMTTAGYSFADQPAHTSANTSNQDQKEASRHTEEIDIKKLSEAFGNFIGRNLNAPGIKFDLESIIKGMRDGAVGKPSPLSDEDYEAMMVKVQEQSFKKVSEDNLKAANDFLSKNAHADKIIEIEPGKIQYMVLEEGHGAVVAEHSSPLIQYVGKYLDGTIFGNSKDVGGSITIPVDQTIPGFGKGIVGMKEGEKRRIFVHPDKGYGTTGHLPPNSLLIFDVEVIKADNKEAHQAKLESEEEEDLLSLVNGDEEEDDDANDEDRFSSEHSERPDPYSSDNLDPLNEEHHPKHKMHSQTKPATKTDQSNDRSK